MRKFTSGLGLVVALCGCGTDSTPGSVVGTVHGQSYAVRDAISASVTINGQHLAAIVLGSASGLCNDLTANTQPPNLQTVIISAATVNGATLNTPTATGTFQIYQGSGTPPTMASTLGVKAYDSTCTEITNYAAKATTGTVVLTAISGEAYDGHYDVVMDSGDHITGSFAPEACPALATAITTSTQPTCK